MATSDSFVKLSFFDNAKIATSYDDVTGYHTLKVTEAVVGTASFVRLSPGDAAKLATDYSSVTGYHTLLVEAVGATLS